MELASYLAGERWSDHPACTQPLLAALARLVNDHTTDAGRNELAGLVPSVIGLTSDDLHVDVGIVLRAATTAPPSPPPTASASWPCRSWRPSACSVISTTGPPVRSATRPPRTGPRARRRRVGDGLHPPDRPTPKGFQRHAAPNTVRHAVVGIAQACVHDPDTVLRELLAATVADVETWTRHDVPDRTVPATPSGRAACQLTGAVPDRRQVATP